MNKTHVVLFLISACGAAGFGAEPAADADKIAAWVAQLGHEDYETRDEAHNRLRKLGPEAFDVLAAAEHHSDPEIARRAQLLLRTIRVPWTREEDSPEVRRLLRNYNSLSERQRRERIAGFGAMTADDATAPLCRIVRYEKSGILSKMASLLIIDRPPPTGAALERQLAAIRSGLAGCRRAPAEWLFTYAKFFASADEGLAEWDKHATAETTLLKASPSETTVDVVIALRKRQYAMLQGLGKKDEALAALRHIVPLHPPTPQALLRLVPWLAAQQAWPVIDEVAKQYEPQFNTNARLLYALAQAKVSAGAADAAQAVADRALALDPDNAEEHLMIASWLQKSGRIPWAEREFRHVIKQAPEASGMSLQAGLFLAAMLQDQARYLDAAKAREAVVTLIEKKPELREILENTFEEFLAPGKIRAGMDYCYAMHYAETGEQAKEKEHLKKAVAADPDDPDILIALWRCSEKNPEMKKDSLDRIGKATRNYERKIAYSEGRLGRGESESKLATLCNEYAWLVANTTGDFDKALKYGLRCNELRPDAAGYLDTLAHCYYAKGDFKQALATQTRANQLEPHSGAIARQLVVFQRAAGGVPRATEP